MTTTALDALRSATGSLGDLVRGYIDRMPTEQPDMWLERWFAATIDQIRAKLAAGEPPELAVETLSPTVSAVGAPSVAKVRLVALRPHYFRGFRRVEEVVSLSGDLVVIEGPNSSGKTSFAECVEWLLTGQLARRASGVGHARELANAIGNAFRPAGETTRVEAVVEVNGVATRVERILLSDYASSQSSAATSLLRVEGKDLSAEEERRLLHTWFGGAVPLLMQHSLRQFIYEPPAGRRKYFESLLHVGELTELIERAVIGDARLVAWRNPSSQGALEGFESLRTLVEHPFSPSILTSTEQASRASLVASIEQALVQVAAAEFSQVLSAADTASRVLELLGSAQRAEREQRLPLLTPLRPTAGRSDVATVAARIAACLAELVTAQRAYRELASAQRRVTETQMIISSTLAALESASVVVPAAELQECPLCAHTEPFTLTKPRLDEVRGWEPLSRAYRLASERIETAANDLASLSIAARDLPRRLVPQLPQSEDFHKVITDASSPVGVALARVLEVHPQTSAALGWYSMCDAIDLAIRATNDGEGLETPHSELVVAQAAILANGADQYHRAFGVLEGEVANLAKEGPVYLLRERLLELLAHPTRLADDLLYERAKKTAQAHLAEFRKALMEYRSQLIDGARASFNTEMLTIWQLLRKDRGSYFKRLHIPSPKGKGFPLEIEVKAELDDGTTQKEVDALRVFSESQANVVGIAAFVARSKLLGHGMMVLDDPVQSMDEEHFGTLSRELLPLLLAHGIQVIILTHNDTFAREVSFSHVDRPDYVTLSMRGSRRKGSCLEEGNRRAAERLKRAEKQADEGHLQDAWVTVRRAIERIYGCVLKKHVDPAVDPIKFANLSAEAMWDAGVGDAVQKLLPGSGERLAHILVLTAAGAHDKAPRGPTELLDAVTFLRSVLSPLRLGSA